MTHSVGKNFVIFENLANSTLVVRVRVKEEHARLFCSLGLSTVKLQKVEGTEKAIKLFRAASIEDSEKMSFDDFSMKMSLLIGESVGFSIKKPDVFRGPDPRVLEPGDIAYLREAALVSDSSIEKVEEFFDIYLSEDFMTSRRMTQRFGRYLR